MVIKKFLNFRSIFKETKLREKQSNIELVLTQLSKIQEC